MATVEIKDEFAFRLKESTSSNSGKRTKQATTLKATETKDCYLKNNFLLIKKA